VLCNNDPRLFGTMKHVKNIPYSLIVVWMGLLSPSCFSPATTSHPFAYYRSCSTASCINEGLLDETPVDTAGFRRKYEAFIAGVDTSARSTEKVNAIVSGVKTDLAEGLQNALVADTGQHNFYLHIRPDGSIGLSSASTPGVIDTSALSMLAQMISEKIGELPETPGLWVSRRITLRDGKLLGDPSNIFSDSNGGRSKASIMEVVMRNLAKMRYAYNRRLAGRNGIRGKITVKFAVDHYGVVISCKVIESTVSDSLLVEAVREQVASWKFGPIVRIGDVTEVIYPFVFSQ